MTADVQLAVALLCVCAAAAVVARRGWHLVRTGGAGGCGSGCGSCPSNRADGPRVVALQTNFDHRT